jgi:hypothetical protein
MARAVKYHEKKTKGGWPMFTSSQTDNRFALCKKALCPDRSLLVRFKDCYQSEEHIQEFCRLKFLSEEYFEYNVRDLKLLPWGGNYKVYKFALEGAFYPFVRCVQKTRPLDTGIIWIGTKHEYPRIWVDNSVANWLCPYSRGGHVMTEPFEPLYKVLDNWARLSDRRFFPFLNLPPVPDL